MFSFLFKIILGYIISYSLYWIIVCYIIVCVYIYIYIYIYTYYIYIYIYVLVIFILVYTRMMHISSFTANCDLAGVSGPRIDPSRVFLPRELTSPPRIVFPSREWRRTGPWTRDPWSRAFNTHITLTYLTLATWTILLHNDPLEIFNKVVVGDVI